MELSDDGLGAHISAKLPCLRPSAKLPGEELPDCEPWPPCKRADLAAKAVLDRADSLRCKVVDDDVLRVLESWRFERNTRRTHVMRDGVEEVCSDMLGLIRSRVNSKLVIARKTKLYPYVTQLLARYLQDNPPVGLPRGVQFPFTTICVNKNYAARRHRDSHYVGMSVIRAFGDFTGGQLRHWPGDDRQRELDELQERDSKLVTVKCCSQVIDSTRAHEVEDFKGTRYSLVYFSTNGYDKLAKEAREQIAGSTGIDIVPMVAASKVWQRLTTS